mgnify:CR=1 FL=1
MKVPNISISCKASDTDTWATPFLECEFIVYTISTTPLKEIATALTSLLELLYRIKRDLPIDD